MFPYLHKDITKALSHSMTCTWIRASNSNRAADREYTTHVMGKFRGVTTTCNSNGWSSKMVAIHIRGYPKNGYNAVVFNQRCKACDQLGTLTLDKISYIERVTYRIQKWAGLQLEQSYHGTTKGLPQKGDFCEGCKRGVCRQTNEGEWSTIDLRGMK